MIAKIVNGSSFGGLYRYLTQAKDSNGEVRPEVVDLGGTISGGTTAERASAMDAIAALRPGVSKPVKHWMVNLAPEDVAAGKVNHDLMRDIGTRFAEGMGATAYTIYSHGDHIHIVGNKVRHDGTVLNDSWDFRKAEALCRSFEREYGLRQVRSSTELEQTEHVKAPSQQELKTFDRTGEASNRMQLQHLIDEAMTPRSGYDKVSLTEFVERLDAVGVGVRVNVNKSGISGMSFEVEGMAFKGQDLGGKYKAASLVKRGLDYEQGRDIETVERCRRRAEGDRAEPNDGRVAGHAVPDQGRGGTADRVAGVELGGHGESHRAVGGGLPVGDGADRGVEQRGGETHQGHVQSGRGDGEARQRIDRGNGQQDARPVLDHDGHRSQGGQRDAVRKGGIEGSPRGDQGRDAGQGAENRTGLADRLVDRGGSYDRVVSMAVAIGMGRDQGGDAVAKDVRGTPRPNESEGQQQGMGLRRLGRAENAPRGSSRTVAAIKQHLDALGVSAFQIGVMPPKGSALPPLGDKTWSRDEATDPRNVRWLQAMNARGYDIYVRPDPTAAKINKGIVLLDDIPKAKVAELARNGYEPAAIIETSPGNCQAWVRLTRDDLTAEQGTAAAKALAEKFGADPKSADYMHYGRLAGFTNRKDKHAQANGLQPFVILHRAKDAVCSKGKELLSYVMDLLEARRIEEQRRQERGRSLAVHFRGNTASLHGCERAFIDRWNEIKSDDASSRDFGAVANCLRRGYTPSQVADVMKRNSPDIERRHKDVDGYVQRTVERAAEQAAAEKARQEAERRNAYKGPRM